MGNSPISNLRPNNYNGKPYSVVLADSATIQFAGKKTLLWMAYKVQKTTCYFSLVNFINRTNSESNDSVNFDEDLGIYTDDFHCSDDKNLSELSFNITVKLNRDDEGLLRVSYNICSPPSCRLSFLDYHKYEIHNVVNNAWGGDTFTYILLHSLGRMRFMLVSEGKTRSKGEKSKPYMFSVTHYYANLENGKDVGLSMQVKRIKAKSCDDGEGRLDFTLDGPHLHPAHALFYMYDEIVRTRNPTCCPHCANNILQSRRMSCPSETEDSDIDTFVTPFRQSQNVRGRGASILENAGRVKAIIMVVSISEICFLHEINSRYLSKEIFM